LNPAELAELATCGRSIAELFGHDCDIEWARAADKLWLLQARPIMTGNSSQQAQLRHEEIEQARTLAEPGGAIWIRNDFARELPEPTPMTWSVVKRMLSARGAYGRLYRDLGFHPAAALDESGCYDLLCGRLYCNMSREPLFYANGLPLFHDLESLRQARQQGIEPRPKLALDRADAGFWFRLPRLLYQAIVLPRRLQRACINFPGVFRTQTLPRYRRLLEGAKRADWSHLDSAQLLRTLHQWIEITLCDYAREALKAGVLCSHLESVIQTRLRKTVGAEATPSIMATIAGNIELAAEVDLVHSLRALAQGTLDRPSFLARFGHRCGCEWELAQPRWSESADALDNLPTAAELAPKGAHQPAEIPRVLRASVDSFRELLGLRELARHYSLEGYYVIRQLLLEWDRRKDLDGGCFYLSIEDLDERTSIAELKRKSSRTRRQRRLLLGLPMPSLVSWDKLEAIGRAVPVEGSINQTLQGIAVSPGAAEGSAFIPNDPRREQPPLESFVLVCAYTAPSWITLAARARGIIMETGSLLSHGAILARELGVPAVGGISDARRLLAGASRVRVDGSSGLVTILS
jgi:rifampicin phosphotransferase